jgi:hypothetical protein
VTPEAPSPDGAAVTRRSPLRRRWALHTLGLIVAGLVTWLVWRGYRQPGLLLDLANAMLLC